MVLDESTDDNGGRPTGGNTLGLLKNFLPSFMFFFGLAFFLKYFNHNIDTTLFLGVKELNDFRKHFLAIFFCIKIIVPPIFQRFFQYMELFISFEIEK